MPEILTFLVGLMTNWVPPADHDAIVRYTQIAADALSVSREEDWLHLTDAETAVLVLSVASLESRFSAAMDSGAKRGDNGQSVCLGGIRVLHNKALRNKIAGDRKECFRYLIRRVRYSWTECERLPFADRLSKYITGTCQANAYSRRYSKRIVDSFNGLYEAGIIDELDDPDEDLLEL